MKLSFSYNIEKDAENFLKSAQSINNTTPTEFQKLYIKKFGTDFEITRIKEFLENYIQENNIDIEVKQEEIKTNWLSIENAFAKKIEEIFGIKYPTQRIEVFLTTNNRCTYNIQENYFFVYLDSKNTNAIIMHELLHFYTWHVFYSELKEKGISGQEYNDIKESLTELLNIEFSDLMNESKDTGYAKHKEMRQKIKEIWSKDKDIRTLVNKLVSDIRQ